MGGGWRRSVRGFSWDLKVLRGEVYYEGGTAEDTLFVAYLPLRLLDDAVADG